MDKCVFCRIIEHKEPAHIVYENDRVICFLDRYPQTRGHLQLVPKIHVLWIYDMIDMASFFLTAQKIIRGIIPVLGCDHVSIGTFGHQVDHAHLWIVPQYARSVSISEGKGKTVFSLAEVAEVLRSALNVKINPPAGGQRSK